MKIIHVGFNFELGDKPDWLDDFRRKYDDPFPYHITLKVNSSISEINIDDVKKVVKSIALKYKPIRVHFNKLFIYKTEKGHCIMIRTKNNSALNKIQKEVSQKLKKFSKIAEPGHAIFETKFLPHITIGRRVKDSQIEKIKKTIPKNNIECSANLTTINLKIVSKADVKNAIDPKNNFNYNLGS